MGEFDLVRECFPEEVLNLNFTLRPPKLQLLDGRNFVHCIDCVSPVPRIEAGMW